MVPVIHLKYSDEVRGIPGLAAAIASLTFWACDEAPASPTQSTAGRVRIVFLASTAQRFALPASAQACVTGVGATHIHPSWRSFAGIPLQPVPPDRYQVAFSDVPIERRVSFRVNDQNSCDENATGAVTRSVFANDVGLVQNTTTPGNATSQATP